MAIVPRPLAAAMYPAPPPVAPPVGGVPGVPGVNVPTMPDLKALLASLVGQSAPGSGAGLAWMQGLQNAQRIRQGLPPLAGRGAPTYGPDGLRIVPTQAPYAPPVRPIAPLPAMFQTIPDLPGQPAAPAAAALPAVAAPVVGPPDPGSQMGIPAPPNSLADFPLLRSLVGPGKGIVPYPGLPAV